MALGGRKMASALQADIDSKIVGIWIRVSTEDQAKGESPEHHERRARYYAESKGWKVLEVYHLEGVSGKLVGEHPETERMLEDIRSGIGSDAFGTFFKPLEEEERDIDHRYFVESSEHERRTKRPSATTTIPCARCARRGANKSGKSGLQGPRGRGLLDLGYSLGIGLKLNSLVRIWRKEPARIFRNPGLRYMHFHRVVRDWLPHRFLVWYPTYASTRRSLARF